FSAPSARSLCHRSGSAERCAYPFRLIIEWLALHCKFFCPSLGSFSRPLLFSRRLLRKINISPLGAAVIVCYTERNKSTSGGR
ncbi:hypothetical protein, partial [Dysosmobacter sp.]|uniref:hypothetical protein n=1 Tax=Dysosmobacter sp. TaxID=2591382 RepID=UPI003AB303C4